MVTPTCCHFSPQNSGNGTAWRLEDIAKPTLTRPNAADIYRPDILDHIEATIKELDGELRQLSLDIHGMLYSLNHMNGLPDLVLAHPELGYKELCALCEGRHWGVECSLFK